MKRHQINSIGLCMAVSCFILLTGQTPIAQIATHDGPPTDRWTDYLDPVIADLDNDGDREIISCSATQLFVYSADGTNFITPISSQYGYQFSAIPAVADVDGDGSADIVIVQDRLYENVWYGRFYAYDNTGTVIG